MAQFGPILTSGEGHTSLGGSHAVERVTARLISINPKQTRLIGNMAPRGVWHAGQAGLGAFPDDTSGQTPPFEAFSQFLHSEYDEWWIPWKTVVNWHTTSVWWRWLAGVSVELTVIW